MTTGGSIQGEAFDGSKASLSSVSEAANGPADGASIHLHCLQGKAAPADLGRHLASFLSLPEAARRSFWSVLEPSLTEPLAPAVEEGLDAFAKQHRLAPDVLAEPIKACRFLLRAASRNNTSKPQFAEDLAALGAGETISALILGGFDRARAAVRQEILRGALIDHGKLLVGVEWRLDRMVASDRGEGLGVSVAVLTIRYREGNKEERISLQALPDNIRELRAICDRLLA